MYYIIGKNNCIWCDRAKSFLDKKQIPYVYKNLDEIPKSHKDRWLDLITDDFTMKTLPVIFKLTGTAIDLEEEFNDD
jgi:glutaredoxin